jgi:hypothetical protein
MRASTTDSGNDTYFLGNGTTGAGRLSTIHGFYVGSNNIVYSGSFWGMVSPSNDATDSSAFGALHFSAMRTDSPTDPSNGILSNIENRKLFSFGGAGGGDIYQVMAANGAVGFNTPTPSARVETVSISSTERALIVKGAASQTANLSEHRSSANAVLTAIRNNGAFQPASMADGSAANNSMYFSTTASRLVYKDASGVVNNLY